MIIYFISYFIFTILKSNHFIDIKDGSKIVISGIRPGQGGYRQNTPWEKYEWNKTVFLNLTKIEVNTD